MIIDPRVLDEARVGRWISEWLNDDSKNDPFEALAQHFSAEAAYHRAHGGDGMMASACERHAQLVMRVVRAIQTAEVDYAVASAVSGLDPRTIRNKKSAGEFESIGKSSRGKVKLGALPIAPLAFPGLHAVRAVQKIKETRDSKARETHLTLIREDEDTDWAEKAHMSMAV